MQGTQPVNPQMMQQLAFLYAVAQEVQRARHAVSQEVEDRVHTVYSSTNRDMQDKSIRLQEYYKSHVETSKETILKGCNGLSGRALVVGVGNGNDIPLEALCRQFDKVTIQDIDEEALARAQKTVPEALRGKLEVVKGDLTGLVENFVRILKSHGARPLPEFLSEACRFFSTAAPKKLDQLPHQQFDYVISAQVSTQLTGCLFRAFQDFMQTFYHQTLDCCSEKEMAKAVTSCSVHTINRHLQDLACWVKPEGKVYFSDTSGEQYLVRPLPGAIPVKSGEMLPMINQDSIRVGLNSFQEQTDFIQNWVWYAFVPDNYAGAKGSAFHVMAMVMKPQVQPR